MKLLAFFRNHTHYWGVPHERAIDNKVVMTCYECGAERQVRIELRPSPVNVVKDDLAA
ncbi:MAG TPA: hypothetical protein VKM94_14970 [Blastocatellia bacterium]|nr:hypothetical protein [Blastocatellia bacterium]